MQADDRRHEFARAIKAGADEYHFAAAFKPLKKRTGEPIFRS